LISSSRFEFDVTLPSITDLMLAAELVRTAH
jgi:hypothetical protein